MTSKQPGLVDANLKYILDYYFEIWFTCPVGCCQISGTSSRVSLGIYFIITIKDRHTVKRVAESAETPADAEISDDSTASAPALSD
jgi:hypothetical protein